MNAATRAAEDIRRHWQCQPRAAVVLGTGLGRLAREILVDVEIPFTQLQHFPRTTAIAHRGMVVCGRLDGVPVILLDGRCHAYEGYSWDEITLPVRAMGACGARMLILSNASGGLNPHFRTGEVMIIEDHIYLMGQGHHQTGRIPSVWAASVGRSSRTCAHPARMSPGKTLMWHAAPASQPPTGAARLPRQRSSPYDRTLIERAAAIARRENFVAHCGVYVGVSGPNYETRAEYRFLRRIGADVVGMSTVPEAIVAADGGMRVLGLSVVTNVAKPDVPNVVDPWHVVDAAEHAEPHLRALVAGVLSESERTWSPGQQP